MKKRLTAICLTAALALSLCGCGGVYEKTYEVVSDYVPAAQTSPDDDERVVVKSYQALKLEISELVSRGVSEGKIAFDVAYEGDMTEDLASACWEVRTQNALCAYCVENMAYDVNKIVTHYEASVYITYAESRAAVEDIICLPYSSGAAEIILSALTAFKPRLVLLINASTYTEDDMAELVRKVYTANPLCLPKKPNVRVDLYTGTSMQRLYEISLDYGIENDERAAFLSNVKKLDSIFSPVERRQSEAQRALTACEYLVENTRYEPLLGYDSAYSALRYGYAGNEGIALAFYELCRQLDLECIVVYGQLNWENHCWNIVRLDGEYYHVDVTACIENGMSAGFLKNDEQMWGDYRWNTPLVVPCNGSLSYEKLKNK